MRLLVLDESQLLAWMVEQFCPPGTEVLPLASFEDARRVILDSSPDAAVVSMTPAHVPWRELQDLCASRTPPVPVLFESCVFSNAEEAGLEPGQSLSWFLRKPASSSDFEKALARLLEAARLAGRPPERPVAEAKSA